MINRSEVNRSLAKAIAFKAVGNDRAAEQWAAKLVEQLECADILSSRTRADYLDYQPDCANCATGACNIPHGQTF